MNFVGTSSVRRNRILPDNMNKRVLSTLTRLRILTTFTNKIKLTIGSKANASAAIKFRIAIKNPTSATVTKDDFNVEVYTSNTLIAKAIPLSTAKTMECGPGCTTCTNFYLNCGSCTVGTYELNGASCIPFPTSKSFVFKNSLKGHPDSYIHLTYQWAVPVPASSKFRMSFSNNWDLTSVAPTLLEPASGMTLGSAAGAVNANFNKQVEIVSANNFAANASITFKVKMKNATSTTVANTDFMTEVFNDTGVLIAKAYNFDSPATMTCYMGCKTCDKLYTTC